MATLVARPAPPEEVFPAVAAEVGRLLKVDPTVLSRYEPDGAVTVVGGWARTDRPRPATCCRRLFGARGRNMQALVFRSRRSARIDDHGDASGVAADVARERGSHAAVGAPIGVEGRLWGVISVASTRQEPLAEDTEARHRSSFTETGCDACAATFRPAPPLAGSLEYRVAGRGQKRAEPFPPPAA